MVFMPWIISSIIVRRLHDLNLSGWWGLLILPILILPFLKGKSASNRFGNADF